MRAEKLVKSTSGVRGIIGRDGLTPVLATQYGAAFGTLLKRGRVVVGRDSRPSGAVILPAVVAGLRSIGMDVVDVGIVPTPTVEIAIKELKAVGGICVTASHNPSQWNALKFFNSHGEFITPAQYKKLDKIFNDGSFAFVPFSDLGSYERQDIWVARHIQKTLAVKAVDSAAVKKRKFTVVVDAVNGAGSVALPALLERLGVKVVRINCDGNGMFVHEPEPIPKNLHQLAKAVKRHKADLGMACDPDADRLALVDERGNPIGEELTLAIGVKAVLLKRKGPTVINLSTSRVTEDTARKMGSKVYRSKVGEANVVEKMRKVGGIIGGEGNGGVIFPEFHAGRDSLIAAALTLTLLARERKSLSELAAGFPRYFNIKTKGVLKPGFSDRLSRFLTEAEAILGKTSVDKQDGLRFNFKQGWLQVRASNTEPIFRLIVETDNQKLTDTLADKVLKYFN